MPEGFLLCFFGFLKEMCGIFGSEAFTGLNRRYFPANAINVAQEQADDFLPSAFQKKIKESVERIEGKGQGCGHG